MFVRRMWIRLLGEKGEKGENLTTILLTHSSLMDNMLLLNFSFKFKFNL